MKRTIARGAAALLLLLAFAEPALARSDEVRLVDKLFLEGELGVSVRTWTLRKDGSPDAKVFEIAAPARFRKPVGAHGDLVLELPGVWASIEEEEKSEYRGPADARLSASFRPGGAGTRVGIFVGIPIGASKVGEEERAVAEAVADRMLGLPIKRFGEGLDVGASLVHGFALPRSLALSAGGGYLRKGEYAFLGSGGAEDEYEPGDEIFLTAGIEGEWDGAMLFRAAADFRFRMFGTDKRSGEDFYEEGDEADLLLDGMLALAPGRRIDVRGFLVFKGEGSERGAFGTGSIDSLSIERYLRRGMTGDYREFTAAYTHRVAGWIDLSAAARAADFGEYAVANSSSGAALLGSGRVFEIGGGAETDLTARLRLLLRAARLFGEAEGGAVDLTGLDLGAAIRWNY
ncbi:MAG: hypothetical protein FJY73_10370 [Candidatus Eisenbacteria bacterium]|nr:hypothetical protein [Candidatus Eisenbacteria bacterium]